MAEEIEETNIEEDTDPIKIHIGKTPKYDDTPTITEDIMLDGALDPRINAQELLERLLKLLREGTNDHIQ